MSRVYASSPQGNERGTQGMRLYTRDGGHLPHAFRVEFEKDASEGEATVWCYVPNNRGWFVRDDAGTPVTVTFRAWVSMVRVTDQIPETIG